MTKPGSLVAVGTGIGLAGQITLISKSYIENADIVFGILPNHHADQWITGLNPNFVSLQKFYTEGKSRVASYQEMVETILMSVREGKKVVGAFYGHPGVFAWVPHAAVAKALKEGFEAHMEPGISAEDCLFADLRIDPGTSGCQAFEATQLLFYNHVIDTTCYLILWQISLAGDHTLKTFKSNKKKLQLTVDYLSQWYALDHEVIIYEAAFLPIEEPRIEKIKLGELPETKLNMSSTMVIPPATKLELNYEMLKKFELTEKELGFN